MNIALQHYCLVVTIGLATACATRPSAELTKDDTDAVIDSHEVLIVDPTIVCRTVPRTGTHIHERRCYTSEELAKMEEKSREYIRSRGARGAVYVPKDPADPRDKDK